MRIALVVGLRAATARAGRTRFALFVVAGAAAWLALATCLAALNVKENEGARARAGEPVLVAAPTAGLPYASMVQEHRGRDVLLVQLGDGPRPWPPGLGRLPAADEAMVSPALRRRIVSDPTLRAWFAGRRVTELPPVAVGSAGELRAYLALPAAEAASADRAVSFGGPRRRAASTRPYEVIGLLLFVAVPAFVLMVTASRFGRGVRSRRFRALRLLGMSHGAASAASAVELAVPAAAGTALGAGLALAAVPPFATLPLAGRHVFRRDLGVAAPEAVLLALVVVTAAAALGAVTAADRGLLRRAGAAFGRLRRPVHLLALLYAAGIGGLAFAWMRHRPRDPLLWASVVVVGAAIPGAIAWVTASVSRRLARPTRGVGWLVALRRIAADPRNATRAAGAIGVAVFVVGAAQPISQVVAQGDAAWTAAAAGQPSVMGRVETLRAAEFRPRTPPPDRVAAVTAAGLWLPGESAAARPGTAAVVATCARLRDVTGLPLDGCVEGRRYALAGTPLPGTPVLRSASGTAVPVALPTETLDVSAAAMPVDAAILLPPGDPALAAVGEPFTIGAYVRVPADEDVWEATRAWVVAASPAHRLENVYEASTVRDSTARWILLGLACVAAFATAGSVLTGLDDRTRRGQWFRLRALGMSRMRVVGTQVAEAAVTSAAAVLVATVGSVGVTMAYLRVNGDRLRDVRAFVASAAVASAAIVLVTVVTAAFAQTDDVTDVEG